MRESYHDGKKSELGYYAPWGEVYVLYRSFYASDEMHRVGLSGIDEIARRSGSAVLQKVETDALGVGPGMRITVTAKGSAVVFELNDSPAGRDLYAQLLLKLSVENYGSNE